MSSSIRLVREKPSQRRHLRVTAPISIQIKNETRHYKTANWSLGGFMVNDYQDGAKTNEEVQVAVSIPFAGFDIGFETTVRVLRVDSSQLAVEFLNLDERSHSLLKHFSQSLIQGEMVSLDETIRRLDTPVTKVSEKPDAVPGKDSAEELKIRSRKTMMFSLVYFAIGTVLFIYMAVTVHVNLNTIKVETAAIKGADHLVTSEFAGVIERIYREVGVNVKKNEPLLLIRNDDVIESVELAKIGLLNAQAELQEKEQLLRSREDQLRSYRDFSANDLEIAHANTLALEDKFQIAQKKYERILTLRQKGLASDEALDRANEDLVTSRANLRIAKAEQSMATHALNEIGKGRYFGDHRFEATVTEARASVEAARLRMASETERQKIMEKRLARLTIVAPEAGTIAALDVADRQAVKKGDVVAVVEGGGSREIEAFIPASELSDIAIGGDAVVEVRNRERSFKAEVRLIDRNIANKQLLINSLANMPVDSSAEPLVRVKLALKDPADQIALADLPSGYPVTVEIARRGIVQSIIKPALVQMKQYQEVYL